MMAALTFDDLLNEPKKSAALKFDDLPQAGFIGRVQGRYEDRIANGNQIANAYVSGDQTKAETLAQFGGQGAAFGGDIAAEAMKSIGSGIESITPEPALEIGRAWLNHSFHNPVMHPITETAKAAAGKIAQGYNYFAEDNPRAARNIEAAANIGLSLGPFTPVKGTTLARPAATLAEEGLSKAAAIPLKATDFALNKAAGALERANTKTIVPGADEVRKAASQMYKQAEQFGGVLKPEFTNKFIKDAESILLSKDSKIRGSRTKKPLLDAFNDLAEFANEPMSLQRAQELDEMMGEMINQNMNLNGTLNDRGRRLYNAQTTFRRMIDTADTSLMAGSKEGFEALKEGRKLWSASRKLDDIERIISRAEMTDNPATAIKTGFRNLYHSKRIAGYSPQEVRALEKAANSGVVGDLLRTAGSRLAPIITAGAGGGVGSTAAAAAASMAARGAATRGQLKRAQDVSKAVAERSGMVRQEQRIPFRELMKLPPREAQRYLNRNSQK